MQEGTSDRPWSKFARVLAKVGVEPRGTSPEEGAAFLRVEYDKWKQVIIEGKIKEN